MPETETDQTVFQTKFTDVATCTNCVFWEPSEGVSPKPVGVCRRTRPAVHVPAGLSGSRAIAVWPLVEADNHCGDWVSKDDGRNFEDLRAIAVAGNF